MELVHKSFPIALELISLIGVEVFRSKMNKRRKRAARKIRGLPQQSTISGSLGSGSFDDSLSVAVSDEKMSPGNRAQNLEYCERIDLISEMEENEDRSKVKLKVFF